MARPQRSNGPASRAALPAAAAALCAALAGPAAAQGGAPAPAMLVRPSIPVSLAASLVGDSRVIRSGLVWRVFEDRSDGAKTTPLAKLEEPAPVVPLPPGTYIVHVTYGFASASKRITVQSNILTERLILAAGALRLNGVVGDAVIPKNLLSYSVFLPVGSNSEGRLIVPNAKPSDLVILPEDTYHVVSTYGDSNAIMRADLRVDPGKVTEATINHRAATVVLKLVGAEGGEALAGTAFSVLTPGGDVIREAIGAFPSVTLAEGEYVAIARHDGQVYQREFKVESGLDRDIEVLAKR